MRAARWRPLGAPVAVTAASAPSLATERMPRPIVGRRQPKAPQLSSLVSGRLDWLAADTPDWSGAEDGCVDAAGAGVAATSPSDGVGAGTVVAW